jgi:hypothetical protein
MIVSHPLSLEKFLDMVIVASDTLMTNIHTSFFHANDANYFLSIREITLIIHPKLN